MSFKSIMGGVLKYGLPAAAMAIPGLGAVGALGKMGMAGRILGTAGKVASAVSPVLGQAAGARADAKKAEINDQLVRDQINQRAAIANRGIDRDRMATGARASLAMADPAHISMIRPGEGMRGGMTRVTGGAAMRDPRLAQIADQAMNDTIHNQLTGEDLVPGASEAPKSGFIDKALGAGSFIAPMIGAFGDVFARGDRTPKYKTPGAMMPNSGRILRNVRF